MPSTLKETITDVLNSGNDFLIALKANQKARFQRLLLMRLEDP